MDYPSDAPIELQEEKQKISVKLISKTKSITRQIKLNSLIKQLKKDIQRQFRIPVEQQSITFQNTNGDKINLDDELQPIEYTQLINNTEIVVKDLGKQIRWDYVFYIEYLGPIVIIPAFYFFGKRQKYSLVQPLAAVMGAGHYFKRELQTAFVHIFSRKSMPLKRVFINSAHYWILFGLLNSIQLFMFPKSVKWSKGDLIILFVIWAFMQLFNFKCHQELSSFRKKGGSEIKDNKYINKSKSRGIPNKWGFQYVSCANYLWETLGWLTFSMMTRCYSSYFFTAVSAAQMTEWAIKKHKAYKKQFGSKYPKNRKAIIPLIL